MLWIFALAVLLVQLVFALPIKRGLQWDYNNDKIRGVNLGGWLVLEPYITPSLFKSCGHNVPVDEYHLTQQLGYDAALSLLQAHWCTFYNENDFKQMASLGLNAVRIPIGYWAFKKLDSDPYVQGQEEYLDKAIEWSRNAGLKVWIDLHGAPGSQNGFDNSGLRDSLDFQQPDNIQLTLEVLQYISEKYGAYDYEDVIIGIELLNEPLGPLLDMNLLRQFYADGYQGLRNTGSVNAAVFQDAFMPDGYWNNFGNVDAGFWNVVIDQHHYQVFSGGELSRSIDEHVSFACKQGATHKSMENKWTVVGEFSAALTDCAFWLNGVGRGARYSGDYDGVGYIGSCDTFTSYDVWTDCQKENARRYVEAQFDAWEQTGGWFFWCWKTEGAIDWDFQRLSYHGVIPSPLTDRQYPNQCGY
ncbi:exo-1,3-beta-glucanase [Scheffersomyces spartinae]|uniref:Glucan 1,3-beta-glucosidase n=1 Tax=Scheffersomyces spartinae TaxID=45513 RepID=A0A9P8AJT3_9ASCO|nr:exo-1,3-beta-glucanase [Scheffersomyces spartinae]KAG7195765.1 exo-1,3-beta-glucanase [Scheffersomyces spartinae]